MGYFVSMSLDVKILKNNEKKLFSLLKTLESDPSCPRSIKPGDHKNLDYFFRCWGYVISTDDPNYITVDYFEGEKLRDDDYFWNSLSPVVEDGSTIECVGEDDSHWIWQFNKGKMREANGVVTYDESFCPEVSSPYEELGINPNSSKEEILNKYKSLMKKYNLPKTPGLAEDLIQYAEKRRESLTEAKDECLKRLVASLIHS